MTLKTSNSRCQSLTKKGKPCRAAATEGGLCFFHANPKKAAELGRIGGRKNRRFRVTSDPLPDLDNVTAVRDVAERLIADVYAGKLNPRTASSLAPLLHLQLRAIEKTDFEKRLAKTEKRLALLMDELETGRPEKMQQGQSAEPFGKRPAQSIKPDGSPDGIASEES